MPDLNKDIDDGMVQIQRIISSIKRKNKYIEKFFNKKISLLKKDFNLQPSDEKFIQNYMNRCLNNNIDISNQETSQLFDQLDTMKNDLKSCQNLFETNKKTTPSAKLITMTKLRIDEIKKETNKIETNVKNKIFLNEFDQFKQKTHLIKQVSN